MPAELGLSPNSGGPTPSKARALVTIWLLRPSRGGWGWGQLPPLSGPALGSVSLAPGRGGGAGWPGQVVTPEGAAVSSRPRRRA